jgi:hypothetical protein
MKKYYLIISLILLSIKANSQENMVTVSGGYSFANIENTSTQATGWRINGLYEFNPMSSKFAHGISFGYISLSSSETTGQQTVKNSVYSLALYYAPKVMFGSDKFKIFIKGALGMQFAGLKREALVTVTDNDFGFYGGGGGRNNAVPQRKYIPQRRI